MTRLYQDFGIDAGNIGLIPTQLQPVTAYLLTGPWEVCWWFLNGSL